MSDADDEILASEYVLGLLEPEDETRARNLERTHPEFAARVARWAQWFDDADNVAEVAPSAGLWAQIDTAIGDAEDVPGAQTLRAGDGPWEIIAPGIERRLLFVDRSAGRQSYYLRMAAGAVLPPHRHGIAEECVLLEGRLRVGNSMLNPGDFHVVQAGQPHPAITAEVPSLFYIHGAL